MSGEYAQDYIDSNIHNWHGGFDEYSHSAIKDVISLKEEYSECLHYIYLKYNFIIKTEPMKNGYIRIKRSSFGIQLLRFYKENGFLTKKQLGVAIKNGDGCYIQEMSA